MADSIPAKMWTLVKTSESESYSLCEVAVPEPVEGEVLVRVELVGICGSDIALYKWNNVARTIATVPFTPGHESSAIVVKCGPGADLPLGQRISVENHYFCGECYQCTHDRRDICQNLGQQGHGRKTKHGACSQFTIVPAKYCYSVHKELTADHTALMEPLGVSHNAIENLEVKGECVLIIGCGPVGVLATGVAKALGAESVIAIDIDDEKLKLAKLMGADTVINTKSQDLKQSIMELTSGNGIGRICECSGAPVMVNSMWKLLRKGGKVVMVGLPNAPLHVDDVLPDIVFKSLQLRTIHGRRIFHTWKEAERLILEGLVDPRLIVSHRFPMSKFEEAFAMLMSGKSCKILIDPHM